MKITDLKELNPCEDGYKFAQSKNSLIEAWNTCERGDWMLWFAQKLDCPVELLTLAKGKCAETVAHLMHDKRSRNAIKIAIDFGNGVATREELYDAAAAAKAAYAAAFDDGTDAASCAAAFAAYAAAADDVIFAAAADAADADAYAAHAACAKAYADACDASASYSDAYEDAAAADAADAAADAAEKENQQQTANICREILTDFILSKL